MIGSRERAALLLEAHRLIDIVSRRAVENIQLGTPLSYPPTGPEDPGLTTAEAEALKSLNLSPIANSALQKLIANAVGEALFGWFCVADGVGDPPGWNGDPWLGIELSRPAKDQDRPMLHDDFFETYWSLRETKS